MEMRPIAITIRSKKLGILIRGARQSVGKSSEECAKAIRSSLATYEAYERGEASPSLPELEVLAYYLKIPIEHFWGRDVILESKPSSNGFELEKLLTLRHRIIGAMLRKARQEADSSLEALAETIGLTPEDLNNFELGEKPLPLPELEVLANTLNRPVKDFQDNHGPVGVWIRQQMALKNFAELSPELQDFISKPVNRPYLELAQRLSEMSVDKLRAVAEGLLEITL